MTIWTCTSCGSPNGSIAERCFRCGAPRVGPPGGPAPGGPGSDEPSLVPLARYDVLPPGGQPDYSQPGHDPAAGGGYVPPEFHQPVQDPAGYVPPGYPQPAGYAPPGYPQPGQDPAAGGYAQPGQDPAAGGYAQPGYEAAPGYADPQYGDRPRRWWVPLLISLVVLLAVGAVTTVVLLGRDDDGDPTVSPPTSTGTAGPTTEQPTTPTTGTTADSSPATPTSVGVVAIDSGVTDARTADVAAMFDSHFSAVNAKNYGQAIAAYDPAGVINPNDPAQASSYQRDISTTTDDQIMLRGIGPDTSGKGVLAARVTFRSNQQAGYGPKDRPNETCTQWDVTYTLSRPGGVYKIFAGKATNSPC